MAYYPVTATTDLTTKGKRLLSWHFEETAAATAQVLIRNGSVSGDIVVPIRLAASDSKGGAYAPVPGFVFPNGVYLHVVSGAVRGSLDII